MQFPVPVRRTFLTRGVRATYGGAAESGWRIGGDLDKFHERESSLRNRNRVSNLIKRFHFYVFNSTARLFLARRLRPPGHHTVNLIKETQEVVAYEGVHHPRDQHSSGGEG